MPKGYLVAHIRAHDMEKMQAFRALAGPAIAKYNGTVLVNAPDPEIKEGPESGISVVVEFESLDMARQFYHSDEYGAARAIREQAAQTDLLLAEGL
ncbi:DUF1330 domain-containing protein [Phaeobacter gallaeciensis]|uniref:DUF1330 domain-containing protein n=2 Tax=Roseobacteraceae TaxID=2854170 RepID=A0A366WS42_9RHOB|nr:MULTISPECIES: DUF1330 domain-containing protein [Roseobacteraceae]MBT3140805.1 DUF1330 domain-containing protein [Falsiruegeria litorea]MBT8170549.1 DUF1330 domain-containing protein [Falsiruegeria litorea]RBW52760.1 DUF1330 domain-containing protein [Phaeobacter gallaeciensis]